MGPGLSRNKGISLSSSEYIAFCDSDDWYEPNYLQLMVEGALKNNADMVFCNHKKVLSNGKEFKVSKVPDDDCVFDHQAVLTMGIDSLCSIMVKRNIVVNFLQPNIKNGEDMAVIPLMILSSSKFAFVSDAIYNYYCRSGSLSQSANEDVLKSLIYSFNYIEKNKPDGSDREIEFLGINNLIYGGLLNHFKYSKDKSKAEEILLSFERSYPLWIKNTYIKDMARYKRLFVKCAQKRLFWIVKILAHIHKLLTEKEK